ncbi:hypothetical protein EJ07DRAFT_162243 [Lizonia empirigonia]|nr:hypothetical protein EJ07DRAFT_162243 [Lizonia empirigonia]
MALSPAYEPQKQGDAPWTQETEDDDNGCLGWLWKYFGRERSNQDTLERTLKLLDRLNFGSTGTPVLSSASSTKGSVVGSGASSQASYSRSTYHCPHPGCKKTSNVPSLIDWHCEKAHQGEGYHAATGQVEGRRDPVILKQDATTATASGLDVTKTPKVLSILGIKAFVQTQKQGKTEQRPQLYTLAEFRKLGDAPVVLEEYLRT